MGLQLRSMHQLATVAAKWGPLGIAAGLFSVYSLAGSA